MATSNIDLYVLLKFILLLLLLFSCSGQSRVSLSDVFYYENGNFTVACTAVKPCSYVNLESTVLSSCNCDICSVQYNRSDLLPTCTECSFMEMSNSSHFAAVVSCKAMKHTSELSCKCDDDSVSTTIYPNCSLDATVSSDSSECTEGEMAADIPNGTLCYTGLTPGSTATYTCHDDYWLNGSSVLECQYNGTWNAPAPHCVMLVCCLDDLGTNATNSSECGDGIMAADIPNGMLCYTGLTPGSTATYSCDKGYELSGTSVLQCQCNGTWNGTASNCMEPNTGLSPGEIAGIVIGTIIIIIIIIIIVVVVLLAIKLMRLLKSSK